LCWVVLADMTLVFDIVWWCATSLHDSPPICFPSERWFSIILSTNTVNILLVPLDPVLSSTHSKYCTLCSNANSSTSSFSTSFSSWEDVVPTSKITNLCGAFYNKNRWRKKLCKPLTIHTKPRQYTEAPTNTGICHVTWINSLSITVMHFPSIAAH